MFWLRYYKMGQSLSKKPTPDLKNHKRNLGNYRQAVENPKSWNLMGYFWSKIHSFSRNIYRGFIQHYFQLLAWKFTKRIRSFLKPYVIFYDIAHLYIKVKIFRLATARIKMHLILHVIFGIKSQFFFRFYMTLQCHETNSSVLFHLNLHMLWTKRSNQSANFQNFDCLYEN